MSHDIEWGQVLTSTQVFANGYAWLVIRHDGDEFELYSPQLQKTHIGRPKPWNKVTVLTPDDDRYRKGWETQFVNVIGIPSDEFAEMLIVLRLGGWFIAEREEGKPWSTGAFEHMPAEQKRAHLLFFHRYDMAAVADDQLDAWHEKRADVVEHEHKEEP